MRNLGERLANIEARMHSSLPKSGPIFIEPRDCTDSEAFALACRAAAGDAPCIVILPENGREAAPAAASLLHLQRSAER